MKHALALLLIVLTAGCASRSRNQETAFAPDGSGDGSFYAGTALADAARELEGRIGTPIEVLEVTVEPRWLTFKVQNPTLAGHVEQYRYDGAAWSGPVVVTIEDGADLAPDLFALREVDLASIPGLVKGASQRAEIAGGEVSRVSIKRQLPYSRDVRISVSVRGPERAGLLWSDAQGRVLEARSL
jgi:hypothetical protein